MVSLRFFTHKFGKDRCGRNYGTPCGRVVWDLGRRDGIWNPIYTRTRDAFTRHTNGVAWRVIRITNGYEAEW